MMASFHVPTTIVVGGGARREVVAQCERHCGKRSLVITDTERDVKMMMLSVHLLPTAALLDYELTLSMPPALTAAVGVDTLTHGIEAYVSRKANGLTDPLALSCIQLVATHLRLAYHEG